jgi:hypothetical protein
MSTRTAADSSVFHQCKFASSIAFVHGLAANLVALRCGPLTDRDQRELIWFVQYLSHRPGGVAAVVSDLLARYSERIGTPSMLTIGKASGDYSAKEVQRIRNELPARLRDMFQLKGEISPDVEALAGSFDLEWERKQFLTPYKEMAAQYPATHPVTAFCELCQRAAAKGLDDHGIAGPNLEREIMEFCLNPEWQISKGGPWYFPRLVETMREYHQNWKAEKSQWVKTSVGKVVCDTLEYTASANTISLLSGRLQLGQSFAARAWCEQNSARARYVEVPATNDDASFLKAIARGIGLGNLTNYKNQQIRERVESVLRSGDLLLVLDGAEKLWPQKNLREAFPGRLAWLLEQVTPHAPVCLISGPQFFMQRRACEKTAWDTPELRQLIPFYQDLPGELSLDDIMAVARVILPAASDALLLTVAASAMGGRYLAAVKAVAKRAQFNATAAGRSQPNQRDIVDAIAFDSGSEKRLRTAIETANVRPGKHRDKSPAKPQSKLMTSSTPPPALAPATAPADQTVKQLENVFN